MDIPPNNALSKNTTARKLFPNEFLCILEQYPPIKKIKCCFKTGIIMVCQIFYKLLVSGSFVINRYSKPSSLRLYGVALGNQLFLDDCS